MMTAPAGAEHTRDMVDPRAPRFGQAITATLLLLAVAVEFAPLVFVVAGVLSVAVLSRWRLDLYGLIWRHIVLRVLDSPSQREAASPHRFAKLLGAVGTGVATGLLLGGWHTAGFLVAAFVGLLAGIAATTGLCLGCQMYRQVAVLRRFDVI